MYKIGIPLAIAFLLVGCGGEKNISPKSSMFQSVHEHEAILLQDGKNKNYCCRCGMDLVKYYKTSHSATHDDTVYQYCSIHCLEDHLGEGIMLKNPKVVDVSSLKFIDSTKAYYVVGSQKSGTMSKISKYAFANEEDAKKFQAQFGGEIMDFYKALEIAKKDFKYYK
ncbi:MAG: nitrous oxide reductase accessory protein NosL [Sulfurimonas sp.]|uniref:nitrous oxide reductase accessory protein NosL n=1 Tax=Sulfurimonas sp. TaxID=2022749 RepID=UPI002631A62D|nr:nitrous oxide reductase accessory protein NosL [Sulfurimonas sp.]MDD5399801.1 nitrous oxide reductase accessory protein NosL [Sulfurimonas sp.]